MKNGNEMIIKEKNGIYQGNIHAKCQFPRMRQKKVFFGPILQIRSGGGQIDTWLSYLEN
jgi:hypothetical protein